MGRAGTSATVGVVGSGYVGTVVATTLAHIGHRVVGLEVDQGRLSRLAVGEAPFFEPGLSGMLETVVRTGALAFTDQPSRLAQETDVVFLCVGTPSRPDGRADMTAVEAAVRSVARHMTTPLTFVTKSTVPIGSGNWLAAVVEEELAEAGLVTPFAVVSNPEFLREGAAIEDFLFPDRVVLGGDDATALDQVVAVYEPILAQQFAGARPDTCHPALFRTTLATAETVKYAANAFLATKISFANEIANICELVDADVRDVITAIGSDHRIGQPFLSAGVGWGGSCFGKDLQALVTTAEGYGYHPELLHATVAVNRRQRTRIVARLRARLKTLQGRRIALLGLAFKPGTDDLRDAPAVDIARWLLAEGAIVRAHDPMVAHVPDVEGLRVVGLDEAIQRADAVVVVTDWPEYADLDPAVLRRAMRGRLVIDARNHLDPAALARAGLWHEGIGLPEADLAVRAEPFRLVDVAAVEAMQPAAGSRAVVVSGNGHGNDR